MIYDFFSGFVTCQVYTAARTYEYPYTCPLGSIYVRITCSCVVFICFRTHLRVASCERQSWGMFVFIGIGIQQFILYQAPGTTAPAPDNTTYTYVGILNVDIYDIACFPFFIRTIRT